MAESRLKRLEYLDSLRGVSMLAVIYFHLCVYLLAENTLINDIIDRWNMPLFFFMSGIFSYSSIYSFSLLKKRIGNRLKQQLYPTIVVWLSFIIANWALTEGSLGEHFRHGLYDPAKVGYWFTFSLVQVFLIYAIGAYLLTRFRVSVKIQTFIYLSLIVVFSIAAIYVIDEQSLSGIGKKIWNTLSIGKTIPLIPFFMAGCLAGMHRDRVLSLMDSTWFVMGCLVSFLVLTFFSPVGESCSPAIYFLSRVAGLTFMVSLFIVFRGYVDSDSRIGRYLQRIGRNTLPIYLFHFFLLLVAGSVIDCVKPILEILSANPVVEIISFTAISAIFAEICLFTESMLKKTPSVHKTIFAK